MTPLSSPDPRYRAWLADRAPRLAPPGLLERSTRAAVAVPQGDRWILRWPILRYAAPIMTSAALVVVIGGALILWPPPTAVVDPSPPATSATPEIRSATPRPPTPAASPVAETPGAVPVAAFRSWTRIEMPDPAPDFLGGGTPIGVAATADGYAVIGFVLGNFGDSPRVAIWTSTDGRAWELHRDVSTLTALRVHQLLAIDERLVALGTSQTACCPVEQPNAAWTSVDAVTWSPVAGAQPVRAAAGPASLVGVMASEDRLRFVRSPDGLRWTEMSTPFRGEVTDLAVDASGRAVALGHVTVPSDADDSYATHIVAWESEAGAEWTSRMVARNAAARAIVAGPDGFVVVGHETIDRVDGSRFDSPRVWRLTDAGLEVVPVALSEGQMLDRVFRVGDDLIATGTEMGELGDAVLAWHSADGGATWARIPTQASLEGGVTTVTAMVRTPGGLLAVGQSLDSESGHLVPVAWIADR